jgi:hypothetical protein
MNSKLTVVRDKPALYFRQRPLAFFGLLALVNQLATLTIGSALVNCLK